MIHFEGDTIYQNNGKTKKSWAVSAFLETYNVLGEEPLETQNKLFKEIIPIAEEYYDTLSETARIRYDFWKQIELNRITPQTFTYTTQVATTIKQWELTISPEGLYYRDISGSYKQPNQLLPQLISDFWFYGPLWPIPDLYTRKLLVATIRNAFMQVGSIASYKHFQLFEYPVIANTKQWTSGDYHASSFVIVRDYGIEYGDQNFHDGLLFLGFFSFEHCLNCRDLATKQLGQQAVSEINRLTQPDNKPVTNTSANIISTKPAISNERSKQLYMDNGGQIHYIYLDGFGDEYHATQADEAQWKQELIQKYTERLQEETNETLLASLLRSLAYHNVTNGEAILLNRASTESLRNRQAIFMALWKENKSENAVTILLDFLKEKNIDSYWHDYAWTSLTRMPDSQTARNWIVECLKGNNERFFQKALDVLFVWSLNGKSGLTELLASGQLSWQNKINNPEFYQTITTLQQIFTEQNNPN
ncbi:hypothetical protein [Xanthocytophaga agilis]|uniref:Uncharacterized protein n=1 Tax=Xanthocytophaga agilis TaxID=3048010 RepID=A0AAE3R1H8_9BACT|nr:hypothetical protein [Xanthocytophaga agilis]MDJ1501936.1 hypothetical protein [Xanthocytophaga agilis]